MPNLEVRRKNLRLRVYYGQRTANVNFSLFILQTDATVSQYFFSRDTFRFARDTF